MIPDWLHDLSIAALLLGLFCAVIIAIDVARHPQRMGIMNVVWPVTALFGTVLTLWGYFTYGRMKMPGTMQHSGGMAGMHGNMADVVETPFPVKVGKGTSHCGAGCTLGDIIAEWLVFFFPVIAVWFGWQTIFSERIFAVWVVDYIFAFAIGIVFQYFSIAPMRGLSLGPGIVAAVKADALSLTAWQLGMYGFMAFTYFYLFRTLLGVQLVVNSVEFWFMMQLAMICGFITAYPMNWWLIRHGIKEAM